MSHPKCHGPHILSRFDNSCSRLQAAESDELLRDAEEEIRGAILGVQDATLKRVYGDDQLIPHRLFEIYPTPNNQVLSVVLGSTCVPVGIPEASNRDGITR